MDWFIVYIVATVLIFPCLIIGSYSTTKVNSTFDRYAKVLSKKGITSCEVAKILVEKFKLDDVSIAEINGKLTDCYDSKHKVIKLSSSVIRSSSLAAIGVTAHELGHAMQDKEKMSLFRFRNFFVPVANFFSRAFVPIMIVGTLLSFTFYIPYVGNIICWISVATYGLSFIFYLITVPLEKNASKRALKMLQEAEILDYTETKSAKSVLDAAFLTYIAAFTTAFVYFLRIFSFAMQLLDNRK